MRGTPIWDKIHNMQATTASWRIGTDCSGLEVRIKAVQDIDIKYTHIFSNDHDKAATGCIINDLKHNVFDDDIIRRNHKNTARVELYIIGFPWQPFSFAGYRKGVEDTKGR